MQRYALPKEINPKKEQLDNKHWRKNITKQSYLPTRSSSRASESSKTLINNNVQNKNNSFKKKNKSIPHSPSKRTFKLSVESLEEKPLNSSEDNTEFKEKAKLVSAIHNKTTEINDRNDTSHSIEQINDKSSRQFLMTSSNSKANLSPSFRTLDELQAKLQSTLEDGDRILEENELKCLKQENKQLNIDLEKMVTENENLQEQLASYAELEKEFSECMIRLKKMTMVVNAKEKEVQELTQEREKNKNIIY
ncbi:hypothetical protein LY90DRAFT_709615, partial [Neocallimastix californiae]